MVDQVPQPVRQDVLRDPEIGLEVGEAARLADYVLPVATQFEKAEATFSNFEYPNNYFHLRRPLLEPPEGFFSEAELHARLCTRRGNAEVAVELSDRMQPGHISLPNGHGIDYPGEDGQRTAAGVSANELSASADRDWLAGTPWHEHTAARIEAL